MNNREDYREDAKEEREGRMEYRNTGNGIKMKR